uniref:ATP-dependent DNA helicase n=1 Tax=Brassica oleracea var. oleracea TaxID=109376 RepID=A0A0D3BUZ7_BRAOL
MQWYKDDGNTIVEVEIMTGKDVGVRVLIPRIQLTSINTMYPFTFLRRQYPLHLFYAMTINKSSFDILCDVPLDSAPGQTDMHFLIMGSSKDICSLFDSYLPNHEAYTHKITWIMFSTQLRSSSKKNQIKQSSYVTVMPFTNQEIFSSGEFKPPEKLEMTNILSYEPTTN